MTVRGSTPLASTVRFKRRDGWYVKVLGLWYRVRQDTTGFIALYQPYGLPKE